MDHARLLSEQEKLMKFTEENESRRLALGRLDEQRSVWTVISENIETRKTYLIDSCNVLKSNLSGTRQDIQSYHDSRTAMMKAISDWELKFVATNNRHADAVESEVNPF